MITDNESGLSQGELAEVLDFLGIKRIQTTVYHPQGNSPIESWHRRLKKGLMGLRSGKEGLTHSSLNDTPGYVTFGVDLGTPVERDLGGDYNLHKVNQSRTEVPVNVGDLVLIRVPNHTKMEEAWSLPSRVLYS